MTQEKTFSEMTSDFNEVLDLFSQKSNELSKKELFRVTNALASYPIIEVHTNLIRSGEIELYALGMSLQSIKLNMMFENMKQDAIEASKEIVPNNIDKPDYASEGEK